jgi:dTDP-4-dehydrorhamnose reductase
LVDKKRILILGGTGLIGSTMYRVLKKNDKISVRATLRSNAPATNAAEDNGLFYNVDAFEISSIIGVFSLFQPDVVINCIGITKHLAKPGEEENLIYTNAVLPHKLSTLSRLFGFRLIHISTDCVFAGKHGDYDEMAFPDANDFYGRSKFLGEVAEETTVTIRTSTVGHELNTKYGLLEWFLNQTHTCFGFRKAIFNGLPTIELAQIVNNFFLERSHLRGLYHVSASPISKYDFLRLVADIYEHDVKILPDDKFEINRSLNCQKFMQSTGYKQKNWQQLIHEMHEDRKGTIDASK